MSSDWTRKFREAQKLQKGREMGCAEAGMEPVQLSILQFPAMTRSWYTVPAVGQCTANVPRHGD